MYLILSILLSAFFIALAAICKALSDTLAHHFDTSIFKFKDKRVWNPEVSWYAAPYLRFTKYKVDAWHISNSFMIASFLLAVVFAPPIKWYFTFFLGGGWFNLIFNTFYNKIFRQKQATE